MRTILFFIIFCNLFSFAQTSVAQTIQHTELVLPKGFVENNGQVMDQFGRPNSEVHYIYSDGFFNLQLKKNGFSYELFEPVHKEKQLLEASLNEVSEEDANQIAPNDQQMRTHRVDVKISGANPNASIVGRNEIEGSLNFYTYGLPECGVIGVNSFSEIRYHDIYPGIDLVFYAANKEDGTSLKYEWVVQPGHDPRKIRLEYSGAPVTPVANDGFRLITSLGTIQESKVVAFFQEDNAAFPAEYRFKGNRVSYDVAFSNAKTIVIDPNIIWSTYYGGEKSEDINNAEMAIDEAGHPILAGSTNSTMYIATVGGMQATYGGGYHDGFLAKFSSNGKLFWATFYGGAQKDEIHSVEADLLDNIYVCGLTTSQTNITTAGSYQPTFAGWQDVFVAKFNSSGLRLWGTYYGGSVQDEALDLDCDEFGNVYFCGYTTSPDKIATPGAYQDSLNSAGGNNGDAFIGEFSPGGNLRWGSYFSGPLQDRAHAIAVGKNGDLFLEGTSVSETDIATPGAYQTTYGGGITDAFLAKWDTNGALIWSTYFGGADEDHGRGVKVDADGNPFIIGWTSSYSGCSTLGALQEHWFESYESDSTPKPDGFIAKFRADGTIEWGTYYGGGGKDHTLGLVLDQSNQQFYVTGFTTSLQNIATPGSFIPTYTGTSDGYIAKFTFGGQRIWGSYFGAGDNEELHGVAMDKEGFIFLFLQTEGNDFPATPNIYQPYGNGEDETILIKFSVADSCFDSYEPNNSLFDARTIKAFSDTTLYGYTAAISSSSDYDWYLVKVPDTNLKIELTDLPADYDLKLRKSNGKFLQSSINPGTADEKIIFNGLPMGSYLIEVVHAESVFDINGCYRIKPMISSTPWVMRSQEAGHLGENSIQMFTYPNPCTDNLNVKISASSSEPVILNILDLAGKTLISKTFPTVTGISDFQISVHDLPSGVFLIELNQTVQKAIQKLTIQK